jgi:type IV secretory pathway TraG/TraD family ATPase VirD4
VVYSHDLSRLQARYQALQRGEQFQTAYTRMAEPGIQALRIKYYPERYLTGTPQQGAVRSSWRFPDFDEILPWAIWGFVFLLVIVAIFQKVQPREEPMSDTYGTAKWADHHDNPADPSPLEKGVFFGKSSQPGLPAKVYGAPITSTLQTHSLIVVRTRAGKGTSVIVPTLLRYAQSMLVIDPKGENAAVTARTRRDQLKQQVHIVNPWGELQNVYAALGFPVATFNPLDAIDKNDPNAVAVAQSLAATICPTTSDKDKFWQGSAANVLTAVLLWLADRPEEEKTLARACELITLSRDDFKKIPLTSRVHSSPVARLVDD